MSLYKIKNLEDQLLKIKMFLPEYLQENKLDVTNGRKITCLSPAHNDNSPSMSMFKCKDTGVPLIKCWSCGVVYDVFNVCHLLEHRPIIGPGFIDDTVMYLSKKYGVQLELGKMSEDEIYEMNVLHLYSSIHKYISHQTPNDVQLQELHKRGWLPEFAKSIGIGVCHSIDDMKLYLKDLGFSYKFMEENDLDHERLFNPNTLIFTIFDEYARPVSFAARNLNYNGVKDDAGRLINGTKFINSKVNSRCGLGKKNELLYMFHTARHKATPLYIFEGNADVVTAHSNGLFNSAAICGLGLNENHLNLCRRSGVYDVVVCLDNDNAGMMKAKQILDDSLKKVHDIKIRFIFLPDAEITINGETKIIKVDPDEFIRTNGIEEFLKLPKVDPFAWRLQQFDFEQDADSESICFAMISIIAADPSPIKREGMVKELSDYTGISEKSIREEVEKIVNADEQKIAKAKRAIADEVMNQLGDNNINFETVLAGALDKIQNVEKEYRTGTLDTGTRMANLLAIKEYQESEDVHVKYNFGDEFRVFNHAFDGDMRGKVVYLGGSPNSGKTSFLINLGWNIALLNENAMVVCLTIDDSDKEFVPRLICYDMAKRTYTTNRELFELISINKVGSPFLYKDCIEYDAMMEERDRSYKNLFSMSEKDKFVLLDSKDGKTLEFINTTIKYYSDKYPGRHLFFFLDNFHLINCPQYEEGRSKYKYLSHEIKATAVKNNCTIISTAEYRKLNFGIKPNNSDLAESGSLEYDSNAIMHMYNDLHIKREESNLYHWPDDMTEKKPVCELITGKNKITSFKGSVWLKFFPDKAYFLELTEQACTDLKNANNQERLEAQTEEEDDLEKYG